MRFFARILLLPLVLAAQVAIAHADSAVRTIGGVNLDLPVPKGYCIADQNNFADAQFIALLSSFLQAGQSRLVMVAVECNSLQKWRAGQIAHIADYATYYVPIASENMPIPGAQGTVRKMFCTEMRKQGSTAADGVKDIIAKKAQEMGQNFGISSTNFIGVMDEDAHGCYGAMLVGVRDQTGTNVIMSAIMNATVVRSKLVFFAFYAEYKGPETTTTGVQTAKTVAVELDAKNP